MNTPFSTWQLVILGALVIVLLIWFRPGLKQAFKQSQNSTAKDWVGALIPLAIVVAFVALLLYVV